MTDATNDLSVSRVGSVPRDAAIMTGRSHARDRAAVVSKTVVYIIGEALRAWFHGDPTDFGAAGAAIEAISRGVRGNCTPRA